MDELAELKDKSEYLMLLLLTLPTFSKQRNTVVMDVIYQVWFTKIIWKDRKPKQLYRLIKTSKFDEKISPVILRSS